jgi:branched-chain amino acid transport system substrate-binding protein
MNSSRLKYVSTCSALVLLLATACTSGKAKPIKNQPQSSAASPSASPITVGAVYPATGTTSVPAWGDGVKAAQAHINNDLGGVNGHPLNVIYCDDQSQDPSKNAACTRNFVSQNVTAILADSAAFGTGGLPVAEAAGIASITPGASEAEQKSKVWIGLLADQSGGLTAEFDYLAHHGAHTVGALIIDIPSIEAGLKASITAAAAVAGLSVKNMVTAPGAAADFTPSLLKAAQGADAVTMSFGAAAMAQILKDAQGAGTKVQFLGSSTAVDIPNLVKPAGAAAEGLIAYSGVLPSSSSDPQASDYRTAMNKAGYAAQIGAVSELGYSYMMTTYDVLKKMHDYSSAAFMAYIKSNPIPVYLGQTYDAHNVPFPAKVNVHVTATRLLEVQNGGFVDIGGGWIDAFKK